MQLGAFIIYLCDFQPISTFPITAYFTVPLYNNADVQHFERSLSYLPKPSPHIYHEDFQPM